VKGDKKRTRSSTRLTVPDSSDEADELLETEPRDSHIPPKHRVLKEVAIMKKEVVPAQAIDQGSSVGSPSLDNSEYETPGTSISTTPAPLRSGKSTRNSSVGIATVATSSRKRGKQRAIADSDDEVDEMDVDMSADAQLARQLQMEEDAYEQNVSKRRRIDVIDNSEDDLSELSDLEFEEEEPQPYTGKGRGRAVDPPRRATRSRTEPKNLIELLDSEEDDFIPEDGSDNDPDIVDLFSSDDEPLMDFKKRTAKSSVSTPAKGKKKSAAQMSAEERRRKREAAFAARLEFDHIADKWERKRAMNRKRAEGNHPKLLTMWDDLAAIPVLEVQKAEQPDSITRRLKPFQLEGLSWMTRQEKTGYKGGLLGDEMGKSFYNGHIRAFN
jgi:DNA repair protein RAD16